MEDKDFYAIALELVKLELENRQNNITGVSAIEFLTGEVPNENEDIIETNIHEEKDTVSLFIYNYNKLIENKKQKVEQESIVKKSKKENNNYEFLKKLQKVIKDGAGDMEPYVKNQLLQLIDYEMRK